MMRKEDMLKKEVNVTSRVEKNVSEIKRSLD